jgi:hypothetical protein
MADLGLGYKKAFVVQSKDGSWSKDLDGHRLWLSFNYQLKKTVWYVVAETLMANGNKPMTKHEIQMAVPDRRQYCLKSPDEWATFVNNGFVEKFRKGNKFTYQLSGYGQRCYEQARKTFDEDWKNTLVRLEERPKTKEEAIDLYQKKMAAKFKKQHLKEIKKAGLAFDGNS